MKVLLIADGREDFIRPLVEALSAASYSVDLAKTPEEARLMASQFDFDICIAHASPPPRRALAGFIRGKRASLPVLAITTHGSLARIDALQGGADDAISRPFSFKELLVRTRALLRRAGTAPEAVYRVADLELDLLGRVAARGGHAFRLTGREFSLLAYLMRRPGQVATRDMIIENVWGVGFERESNVVDVYINYLRGKIDNPFPRKLIQTIRGAGYTISDGESLR